MNLFVQVGTQWRPNGSGLDYMGVRSAMDMLGIKQKRRAKLFADLQVMEDVAVVEMRQP